LAGVGRRSIIMAPIRACQWPTRRRRVGCVALVGTLRAREELTPALLDKFLVENARRFYGL